MMDHLFNQSALLRQAMLATVDYPLADNGVRFRTSLDATVLSLEHAEAVRMLMEAGLESSAAAMLRCQFEAFVRGVWLRHCASDDQVKLLSSSPKEDEGRALPMLSKMIDSLAQVPDMANLVPLLEELKKYAWSALNSFIHAGVHAVDRSRAGFPLELAVNVVRYSNNLLMMAGQHMAILTGVPGLQGEVRRLSDVYADCLLLDEGRRRAAEAAASTPPSS